MVAAVGTNHERVMKPLLFLWKHNAFRQQVAEGMRALRKKPRIVDGAYKLEKVHNKRPRKALRSFNRNARKMDKRDDAAKKLLLIQHTILQKIFDKWAGR